jgi:RNA polymerase sigma-70 factor (ECF subfamily)
MLESKPCTGHPFGLLPPLGGGVSLAEKRDPELKEERLERIVAQVRAGSSVAVGELYLMCHSGLKYFFWRKLGPQDALDGAHDTFLIILNAILTGELREPSRLFGFMQVVAHRQFCLHIARRTRKRCETEAESLQLSDPGQRPDQELLVSERAMCMKRALRELTPKDREILERFYVKEQNKKQICRELNLTETQFRLLKSRAKAKLVQGAQRGSSRRQLQAVARATAA